MGHRDLGLLGAELGRRTRESRKVGGPGLLGGKAGDSELLEMWRQQAGGEHLEGPRAVRGQFIFCENDGGGVEARRSL